MESHTPTSTQKSVIWLTLFLTISIPPIAASFSPLLQYRQPIYIAAGFAGIAGLVLLLLQPLLAGNYLPSIAPPKARKTHRIIGATLLFLVVAHVVGLWITSPPDVIDALLLRSPTPFSLWGVIAMWAIFATALLAMLCKKLRTRSWRYLHVILANVIASSTIAHAMLIDGTMEWKSKFILCAATGLATIVLTIHFIKKSNSKSTKEA